MKKIVLTGPESTGKTEMARALAAALGAPWAPEFARYYVGWLGRSYERADLRAIGRGQRAWEDWHAASAGQLLICDTDWTVLQVWEEYRFGPSGEYVWQSGYGEARLADLYLLCLPDFPWAPDPLREHPEEREAILACYERLLERRQAPVLALAGSHAQRFDRAMTAIRELS